MVKAIHKMLPNIHVKIEVYCTRILRLLYFVKRQWKISIGKEGFKSQGNTSPVPVLDDGDTACDTDAEHARRVCWGLHKFLIDRNFHVDTSTFFEN